MLNGSNDQVSAIETNSPNSASTLTTVELAPITAMPDSWEQQRLIVLDNRVNRIDVSNIYLGINRFGGNDENMQLFMRVDGRNNRLVLVGLNRDSLWEKSVTLLEALPFEHIKKIMCGPVRHGSSQCFIVFGVTSTLSLNSAGVGPTCMLSPTLTSSTINSAKHVLVLLNRRELDVFKSDMEKLPYTHVMQRRAAWLHYENRWPEYSVKTFLFAHLQRGNHTIDELRDRAAREIEAKQRSERHTRRVNSPNPASEDGTFVTAPSDPAPQCTAATPAQNVPAAKRRRVEASLEPARTTGTSSALPVRASTGSQSSAPSLPPPPPLSSEREYLLWQSKRDRDIAEIKNTLRDKELCALLSRSEIDLLKSRLVQLMLQ